ncbi:MAG TPA: Trm112 family protein [Candidatus Eisenbacteria bacterium]|nr:Trm112 family protein [Candidatus Eisenbacteria bacterium]
MPLSEELLAILVCPQCRGDLRYDRAAEKLICEACRLRYPVVDGVPVMLPEEAEKIEQA